MLTLPGQLEARSPDDRFDVHQFTLAAFAAFFRFAVSAATFCASSAMSFAALLLEKTLPPLPLFLRRLAKRSPIRRRVLNFRIGLLCASSFCEILTLNFFF